MVEISRPWSGVVTGDSGPYSSEQWQILYQAIIGFGANRANNGVFLQSGTEPDHGLKVTEATPNAASVLVLPGSALVQGIAYINSSNETLSIAANSSGNARIDTVVLQADYALQTVRLVVLTGTPAASPVSPSLTQSTSVLWEIPVADIAVANGFTTIVNANITQRQEWVNAPGGVYLDSVLNNSGAIRKTGDVVVIDTSANRAATTTTTRQAKNSVGVWQGKTEAGGTGKVLKIGIGYVLTDAAVTRGALLTTSTTAGAATTPATGEAVIGSVVGRALETTSGAGLVLAHIDCRNVPDFDIVHLQDQKASGTGGGTPVATTWTKHVLNTEVADTGNIATLASDVLTLPPGVYSVWWTIAVGANITMRSRLRNTTAGSTLAQSVNTTNTSANSGSCRFVLTTSSNIELQYWAGAATVNGLGLAMTTGDVEVYATVYIMRHGETG